MFKITEDHEPGTQVLHVLNAQDTVVQQIVFGPGGHTGWHSHPGPVVVLVAQGELTRSTRQRIPRALAGPIQRARRSSIGGRATSTSRARARQRTPSCG